MVHLNVVLNPVALKEAIDKGHIRAQSHADLTIYTYTQACAYEQAWTHETRTCRGLVVDSRGMVLARPFPKFFNYQESHAPVIHMDDPVIVSDKVDGSLGILVPHMGGHIFATKGSFASPQALWATRKWNETYAGKFEPIPRWTYLFEIVHPQNRIVVDYAGMEDLVLLGAVNNGTGRTIRFADAADGWPGPTALQFEFSTFRDVLEAPPRPNAEGFVVHLPHSDQRVKIKQEDYIELHRIVTGLNEKTVWEILARGDDPRPIAEGYPDEFKDWIWDTADDFENDFGAIMEAVIDEYDDIIFHLPLGFTRAEFAEMAKEGKHTPLLFLLHDEQFDRLDQAIWKSLKPAGKMATFNSWELSDEAA